MINRQKIFYDNIKIEIEAGQYYIEDMLTKLTKATAKNLLTVDMYEELEILAKEKADPKYEKTVTVEDLKDKMIDLDLEEVYENEGKCFIAVDEKRLRH